MKQQYIQRAVLSTVFNEPRDFAGRQISFTEINKGLYLTLPQSCDLLTLTPKPFRYHLESIILEEENATNKGGGIPCPPLYLTVYEAEVTFQPVARVGGGGGTQTQKFYHHELIIRIAERMQNTERKEAILNWMRGIVSEYVRNGFVLDEYAVANSPTLLPKLNERVSAFNFSPERYAMVVINNRIDTLFYACSGIYNEDGSVSRTIWEYFRRCCHNTAHVASVGMTASQIRYTRSNPNMFTFGQENFRGKFAPHTSELNNACNFLTDYELMTRTASVERAMSWIMTHIKRYPGIHYTQVLKMFTHFNTGGPYLKFISDNWSDYPETAVDNLTNVPNPGTMRAELREVVKVYLDNFPYRHTSPSPEAMAYANAKQYLINENLQYTGLEDIPIPPILDV